MGVSDGSFKNKFGTACWIFLNESGSERIVGLSEVLGFSDEHDAHRSKLAALYVLTVAVKILKKIGGVEKDGI